MQKLKPPRIYEHAEQSNFFAEVKARYSFRPDFIDRLLFAVPNGMFVGGRNPYALVAKYKAEGMKPGTSDILYLQARGPYFYLAIEMKATDKRNTKDAVSPDQAEFLAAVNQAGGLGEVCYGCDEALLIFDKYMSFGAR